MASAYVVRSDKEKTFTHQEELSFSTSSRVLGGGACGRWVQGRQTPPNSFQSLLIKGPQIIHRDLMGSKRPGCPLL